MGDIFYCYSKRLCLFLKSMNESYIKKDTNKNTNTIFWTFKKSDRLDYLISLWREIKNK